MSEPGPDFRLSSAGDQDQYFCRRGVRTLGVLLRGEQVEIAYWVRENTADVIDWTFADYIDRPMTPADEGGIQYRCDRDFIGRRSRFLNSREVAR